MAEFKQIIDDALDILKFDGAVQDTLRCWMNALMPLAFNI